MADKEITMVLKVDLECERCNKKIRRVLHKIKDKMNIHTISVDEKRNRVTISGPFDETKIRQTLCCKAGRIIKRMDVEKEKDGGMEKEEDRRMPVANLDPLLEKMKKEPITTKPKPPCSCCCGCTCGKQTTQTQLPAAQVVVAAPPVWHTIANSVSGHGYEAPSSYYGVPVYSIQGW